MKTTLPIIAAAFILSACNSSNAKETTGAATTKAGGNNIISFKADGTEIKTSGFNISRFRLKKTGELHLSISSNMQEDVRTINANIGGTKPGIYEFKENDAYTYGNYYPDFKKDLRNSFSFISGSFVITEIDTAKRIVNAHFSGTVRNGKGQEVKITDGKIENGLLISKVEEY